MENTTDNNIWRLPKTVKEIKLALISLLIVAAFATAAARSFMLALNKPNTDMPLSIRKERGNFYDRKQLTLTLNETSHVLCVNKNKLKTDEDKIKIINDIAPMITGDRPLIETKRYIIRRLKRRSKYIVIKRRLNTELRDEINKKVAEKKIKGIYFDNEPKRKYLYGEIFAHIIGHTDIDNKGVEGLEYSLDEKLNPDKRPQGSADVYLSLDAEVQMTVHKELKKAVEKSKSKSGIVIIEEVDTGKIISAITYPGYDPNNYSKYTNYELKKNKAFLDIIEPGSTFKIFAGAYAVELGVAHQYKKIEAPGYYEYDDGFTIRDSVSNRTINFEEIFKYSCNYGIIKIAEENFSTEGYYAFLRRFGFGERTGIESPGETRGIIRPPNKWSKYSKGFVSIGQEIGVSALQLVNAYSALVNGGLLMQPSLVDAYVYGNKIIKKEPQVIDRVLDASVAEKVKELLAKGVEKGSTGSRAALENIKVVGKTGTAQISMRSGGYFENAYNSIFVGAFPLDKPKVAMIVVLNKPSGEEHSGGKVAAPLFRNIALQIIPPLNLYSKDEAIDISDDSFVDLQHYIDQGVSLVTGSRMPLLLGMTMRDALVHLKPAIEGKELELNIYGSGFIAKQVPAAGEPLKGVSEVRLILSPELKAASNL